MEFELIEEEMLDSEDSFIEPECRICFDTETRTDLLLYPCLCNGTSRYIHTSCLKKWRTMNNDRPAFLKCMECGSNYNIVFSYPRETFTFSLNYTSQLINIFVFNSWIFALSLFIRQIDMGLGAQSIKLIDTRPSQEMTNLIEDNSLYSHFYYFSLTNFFFFSFLYAYFVFITTKKTKNTFKYWKKMYFIFLIYCMYISKFIWLYYMTKGIDAHIPLNFINLEFLMDTFNMAVYNNLLKNHNELIDNINRENVGEVKNREDNDIV